MIQIKPEINHRSTCPHCKSNLRPHSILWQGIHVCAVSKCYHCGAEIIEDLNVGHALYYPHQVDLGANKIFFTDQGGLFWFGKPLLQSLKKPRHDFKISLNIEKIQARRNVIILNCIDYLYGHSLLKLLNAENHLNKNPELGLIVIIPSFLRWMIPQGVAEIWTVDMPLSKAQNYVPDLNVQIQKECSRFEKVYVSRAHVHPKSFDITKFTGIQKHDFKHSGFRITFIWREDRPWWEQSHVIALLHKLKLHKIYLSVQRQKIIRLFRLLGKQFPSATLTLAGLGITGSFPKWIDDKRVALFDEHSERQLCRIYSESRLVIGVHGSNLLLPSGHAGMTIDLMPLDRWDNIAQDILFQERDSRLSSYRYRYIPLHVGFRFLAHIASHQIKGYEAFKQRMAIDSDCA